MGYYLGYGGYVHEREMTKYPMYLEPLNDGEKLSKKLSKGEKLTPDEKLMAIGYNDSQRKKKQQKKKSKR